MKDIRDQLKKWDEIEERIRTLVWARNVFIAPKLARTVAILRAECGFDESAKEIKEIWAAFEAQISLKDAAEILLHLRSLGALIEHFIEAYHSPQGGSVDRALALLNPRMKSPSVRTLPIEWRN